MHASDPPNPTDPATVDILVANHRRFLAFLERRLGSRALAEDVLQDAFVRGVTHLDSVQSEESVVAWFFRVLRNAVTDQYRRRAATDRKLAAFARELEATATPEAPLTQEVCRCIEELRVTLKPEYAEALARVELEGLAVRDYAAAIGVTPNTAAVRLHRARNALRARVQRACGTCAEHGCLDCTCNPGACA